MGGRLIVALATLTLWGCVETPPPVEDAGPGEPMEDAGPGEPMEDAGDPVDFETQIQPLLVDNCSTCHEGRGSPGPMFLELGNYEASVLAHPMLVMPGEPEMSLILTKGEHRGPMWPAEHAAVIRAWILQL